MLSELLWLVSKEAALAYSPKTDAAVLSAHRWFENKSYPWDYLYSRYGQLAKEINQKLSGVGGGISADRLWQPE